MLIFARRKKACIKFAPVNYIFENLLKTETLIPEDSLAHEKYKTACRYNGIYWNDKLETSKGRKKSNKEIYMLSK